MPIRPCPVCVAPTVRWLKESSRAAQVNYYRCDECGHVWATLKTGPQLGPPVTISSATDQNEREWVKRAHLRIIRSELHAGEHFLRSASAVTDGEARQQFLTLRSGYRFSGSSSSSAPRSRCSASSPAWRH
jgi:hypothetical protein